MFIFKSARESRGFRKRRTAEQVTNDLNEYLKSNSKELVRWLAGAVQGWDFSYSELEAAIADGRLNDLIDWQARYAKLVNELTPALTAAMAAASAKATKKKVVLSDSMGDVKAWLTNHGGELITRLSDESRRAVVNVLLMCQEQMMNPRRMAQQIRPLIGLNAKQVEANANYRERLYQRYRDGGLNPTKAAAKADAAALRYASKQHRYRAETIVHTELAYAYNNGAHEGVIRAINAKLMPHCEMVWTTAGTNRVCGRCMELKDTVVGRTDEGGVQLPPLHPRCRCTISYREIIGGGNKPQIIIANYEDIATPRSREEFIAFANKIKPSLEQYAGRESKWNGEIILANEFDKAGGKLWNCTIRLNPDAPLHALIHELLHSCSVSYFGIQTFKKFRWEEELTVHYLSQELAAANIIALACSGYDDGVELIREFKTELDIKMSDLEFASALIKEELGYRWEWLAEKVLETLGTDATIEQYNNFMKKLEAIRQWKPLN